MSISHFPTIQAANEIPWYEQFDPDRRLLRGPAYRFVKRALDLMLCLLLVPLILLVLAICALLIKLDSPGGPVLFQQPRTGRGGRRFGMFKLRTMVPHAEELKSQLLPLNELKWPDFKITNDPRVTRIGRLLRKTSLDELPQIINVIKGEMSWVGPRPTSFASNTYLLWQTERLDVVPGITGLWQVIGRAETEFDERLRLDIAYIERQCLSLDVAILVRTLLAVLQGRGAH